MDHRREIWKDLNRSLYVGDRLKANLSVLTFVSLFTAALGLVLILLNVFVHKPVEPLRLLMSFVTLFSGIGCAFCARVLKRREIAVMIPTLFSIFVFTVYAFTGRR